MRHIYSSLDNAIDLLSLLRKGKKIPPEVDLDKVHADLKLSRQILERVANCFDRNFPPDDELIP